MTMLAGEEPRKAPARVEWRRQRGCRGLIVPRPELVKWVYESIPPRRFAEWMRRMMHNEPDVTRR